MDVGNAVHGPGGTQDVIELLLYRVSLLAAGQGLLVVTELGMKPADAVERAGLASPTASELVMAVRELRVPQRLGVVAVGLKDAGNVHVSRTKSRVVANLAEELQPTLVVVVGVVPATEPGARQAE